MKELSDLNFNHYVNLFTSSNNEPALKELYLLREKCPEFDFSKYKVGVFTLPNIEKFGQDFLLDNYHSLTESLLELDKDRVDYIVSHEKFLTFDHDNLGVLTFEELEKINAIDDCDILALLSELSKVYNFKKILNPLLKKMGALSFIAQNFEEIYSTYLRNSIKKFILDPDSEKALGFIDKKYITTSTELQHLLDSYFSCKMLIPYVNEENSRCFSDLLFNNHILKLQIKCKDDLDNYYEIKYNKVINLIDNNFTSAKEIISNTYFNISYDVLKKSLITAKKCKLFEKYTKILDINTREEMIEFLSSIKYNTNIYYEIENELSLISKKSICDSIRPKDILTDKVVVLDGCDFNFLIHSIHGYANRNQAGLLANNPALWYSNPRQDSYISTSYISHNFMGMNNSLSYVLGFNNIEEDDILYAGSGDIYSSTKQVRNNLRNGKSSCMLADDLSMNPKMIYNEVTLRRVRNGKILSPDFILSLDTITEKDKAASNFFKVPIYLLERIKYAAKMEEQLEKDLNTDDLESYLEDLRRMFFSFCNCDRIFIQHFNQRKLESDTLKIIKKYIGSDDVEILRLVEEIISLYDSLIISYNFYKDSSIEYDKKRYVNMLKK